MAASPLAAPCDPFTHLYLFFSCRKTDCVHHKTTASSHLLPLLNWQWGTTATLPTWLNFIPYTHSLAASLLPSLSVTFLHCSSNTRMKPYGKLTMLCIPCWQPDVTLRPLDSKTTPSALQLAWTTLMLSFFETVASLVFSRRSEQRLIKQIKKELLESYQDTLWWDFP